MNRRMLVVLVVGLLIATGCASRPRDAIVLFDGQDLSKWHGKGGEPAPWKIVDGAMEVVPRSGDIWTTDTFEDCRLHVEFRTPVPAEGDKGQHRGNSGVFLMDRYEIQVLESFGLPASRVDCGALYSITAPKKNVAKPPMKWQTYDITFRAPRHDSAGKKIENGRLTLIWNGVKVHDDIEVPSPTRKHDGPEPPGPAPIRLQDHGFAVQYRNIWIVPGGGE
jgi:hypothetical protein